MSLPVVDLSPFLEPSSVEAKRTAASALDSACRIHGFFYLSHHGIPAPLEDRVLSTARDFFLSSTVSDKSSILRRDPGKGGDGARGYQRLGENVTQGHADYHEAIDFYRPVPPIPFDSADPSRGYQLLCGPNLWPEKPVEFKEVFEQYWQRLTELGHATMKAMAWALGYEDDEDVLLRDTEQGYWVARVIGYPPLKQEMVGEGVSCGVHTDYGCTTFLLADDIPGSLQVLSKSGEWINADMIKDCFVVNIGDMMEVWTNGLWESTKHRVVHTKSAYRVSVPFFYEPRWDAVVRPLGKCVQQTGGTPKFGVKIYGEHLIEKVSGNFYSAPGESAT